MVLYNNNSLFGIFLFLVCVIQKTLFQKSVHQNYTPAFKTNEKANLLTFHFFKIFCFEHDHTFKR